MREPFVFAVGGLNLDVCGVPSAAPRARDSNPGRVTLAPGGVAHNIARRLAIKGARVELAAPLGDDAASALLLRACAEEGVSLAFAPRFAGRASCYVSLHDETGDMVLAVNDMDLLERFTPDDARALLPAADGAALCVADANLRADTLRAFCEGAKSPILLDPVSACKAPRALTVMDRLALIKPNRLEAERLTGESDPARAARRLLSLGAGLVLITLGAQGVYYADRASRGLLPAPRLRAVNCTGAGDAFAAGAAMAFLEGADARACASRGISDSVEHLLAQGGVLIDE